MVVAVEQRGGDELEDDASAEVVDLRVREVELEVRAEVVAKPSY